MFKKSILISLLLIVLLTGCNKNNNKNTTKVDEPVDIVEDNDIKEKEEEYIDDNPIIVGLYDGNYNLVKEYYTARTRLKDIVFLTMYTNDEVLPNNYMKSNWLNYKNMYSDIDNYKIGYNVSFEAEGKTISKNITYIEDEYIVNPYFYVYLYDDINQADGSWYSHLTKDDVKDYNIFTSIKLFLVEPDKITSPITLTVFTYDGDEDFDDDGNYRGNSKYQLTINWLD